MGIFQICAAVIGGLLLIVLLKQYNPVFALVVSLLMSAGLLVYAAVSLTELQQWLSAAFSFASGEYYEVLLKMIGIGLIVQTTAELCRESGQEAAAGKVTLVGKIVLMTTALPLFRKVLEMLLELLQ